ncbi:hypothetical protein HDU90_001618 [Geranomyces variabilis]|nr:hypothetical protein HDU90_001618 [Geranomyces variabilis]
MSSVVANLMALATGPAVPPIAKKQPYTHEYHGVKLEDPYHWLKDMNKEKRPEIIEALNAENDYAKALHLTPNEKLVDTIYREFISRLEEDDVDVPVFRAPYFYYKRTEKGKQYPIYARRKDTMEGTEEVLLNQNEFTHEYQELGFYKVSPDHSILAYSIDIKGDEIYTIVFKDLKTGKDLPDTVKGASSEAEWSNDVKALYYTKLDDIHRTDRIFRHVLGTDSANDELIYKEDDFKFGVGLEKSNSGEYIFIGTSSSLTREYHFLDANKFDAKLKLFQAREFRVKYDVEHQGNRFFIRTDGGGKSLNGKLCSCPLDKTEATNWVEILPYDPLKQIVDMVPFKSHLALYERSGSLQRIRVLGAGADGQVDGKGDNWVVPFTEEIFHASDAGTSKQTYTSTVLRFNYSSLLTPTQTFEYDFVAKSKKLLKQTPVPNYDVSKYVLKRIYAPIPESTKATAPFDTPVDDKIPISIVYDKTKFKGDGTNPALLYGYGSYGITIDPVFKSQIFSYVDRGYVYAIAHIRGGGENGRAWYETGKFKNKRNTFTDFIAAGEELIKQKFTSNDRMAIEGRSAGGLLIGATVNLKPDLAAVAIAGVPFVDVINTMMDEKIPLTVNEYEEWGNPNEKGYFDYMLSYSPYENVKKGVKLPDILVKAGLNDPRVQYWEPAKWVAKLRDSDVIKPDGVIVFDCKMGSGHFGHSGRYAYLREVAADYAFVIDRIAKKHGSETAVMAK